MPSIAEIRALPDSPQKAELLKRLRARVEAAPDSDAKTELLKRMDTWGSGATAQGLLETAEAAPPPPYAAQLAGNIAPSLGRALVDVTAPIHSPVQTLEGVGNIAVGLAQKLIPGAQDKEKYADAIGRFLVDRYGSADAIKETLKTDPAGMVADVAGLLTGGAGLAAKGAGMAGRAGMLAKAAGQVERVAGKAGRIAAAADPFQAGIAGAKKAGQAATEGLGVLTGMQAEPIREAARIGRGTSKPRTEAFLQNIRGQASAEDIVPEARQALAQLHRNKMDEFSAGQGAIFGEAGGQAVDFEKLSAKIGETIDETVGDFKGITIRPSSKEVGQKVRERIDEFRFETGPDGQPVPRGPEFHTVEGADALRQSIGDVLDATEQGTPERRIANKAYHAVREAITEQVPEYGDVLKNYFEAETHLRDLEKALSLGEKVGAETSIRKLQAVMRDDVTSAYGQRGKYAKELEGAGAETLMPALAGQSARSFVPRGIRPYLAAGAGLGLPAVGGSPLLMAAAPLTSPRLVAMGAFRGGQLARHAAPLGGMLARRGVPHVMYQAGRAGGQQ